MKHIIVLLLAVFVLVASYGVSDAQQTTKVARIGVLRESRANFR